MKKSKAGLLGSAIAAVLLVAVLTVSLGPARPLAASLSEPTPTPSPAATPAPPRDPLQIEAIRARTYSASQLVVTQELGDQGGYREAINSFHSDGLKQYALVSTPTKPQPAAGWPVVILAHGYIPPAKYLTDGANYASIINELARAGYLVIKPDYRGHGRSEGQPEGGYFSPGYTYDVLSLIATIKNYPAADPSRIGLLGHSLGGQVALRTIVVSPDVKATVLMAGVVGSMDDLLYHWPGGSIPRDQSAAPVPGPKGAKAALIAKYGTPRANPAFWDTASAINYVSFVKGPVQIHHSAADSLVPKFFSDHLDTALQAQAKPVEYYVYPGNDHQLSINRTLFMKRVLDFYAANL